MSGAPDLVSNHSLCPGGQQPSRSSTLYSQHPLESSSLCLAGTFSRLSVPLVLQLASMFLDVALVTYLLHLAERMQHGWYA